MKQNPVILAMISGLAGGVIAVAIVFSIPLIRAEETPKGQKAGDTSDLLRVRCLELVDSEGHVRARMSVDKNKDGEDASLAFLDGDLKQRVFVGMKGDVPTVSVQNATGKTHADLSINAEGESGLLIEDVESKYAVQSACSKDGAAIQLFDKNGQRLRLITSENFAIMQMYYENEKESIELGTTPEQASVMRFKNFEGQQCVYVGENDKITGLWLGHGGKTGFGLDVRSEGSQVYLNDQNEKARILGSVPKDGEPRFSIKDANEKNIWQAPSK